MMKNKTFVCVEMKRRGAELVRRRLAGMTIEQEIEYWRKRSEDFQRDQDHLRASQAKTSPTRPKRDRR